LLTENLYLRNERKFGIFTVFIKIYYVAKFLLLSQEWDNHSHKYKGTHHKDTKHGNKQLKDVKNNCQNHNVRTILNILLNIA
jgi:hypothetical protein